jgi:hypothetical protein
MAPVPVTTAAPSIPAPGAASGARSAQTRGSTETRTALVSRNEPGSSSNRSRSGAGRGKWRPQPGQTRQVSQRASPANPAPQVGQARSSARSISRSSSPAGEGWGRAIGGSVGWRGRGEESGGDATDRWWRRQRETRGEPPAACFRRLRRRVRCREPDSETNRRRTGRQRRSACPADRGRPSTTDEATARGPLDAPPWSWSCRTGAPCLPAHWNSIVGTPKHQQDPLLLPPPFRSRCTSRRRATAPLWPRSMVVRVATPLRTIPTWPMLLKR